MSAMPAIFTLAESAAIFSDKIGRKVTDTEALELFLSYGHSLYAVIPADVYTETLSLINGKLWRIGRSDADIILDPFKVPSITRGLALLRPHHIQSLLVQGEVITETPACTEDLPEGEITWPVLSKGVRVGLAEVRVGPDTLDCIIRRYVLDQGPALPEKPAPEVAPDDGDETEIGVQQ